MTEFITISLADLQKTALTYHHEMLRAAISNCGGELFRAQEGFSGHHYDREEKWQVNKVLVFTNDAIVFFKPKVNSCRLFEGNTFSAFDNSVIGKGICFLQFIDWVDYDYATSFGNRAPSE